MTKKENTMIYLYDERPNRKDSRVSVGCREVYRGSYEDCLDRIETISKSLDNIGTPYMVKEKSMD